MMLIAASWPSNRLAAVTNRTGLTGTWSAGGSLGTAVSALAAGEGPRVVRGPENTRMSYYCSAHLLGRPSNWARDVRVAPTRGAAAQVTTA